MTMDLKILDVWDDELNMQDLYDRCLNAKNTHFIVDCSKESSLTEFGIGGEANTLSTEELTMRVQDHNERYSNRVDIILGNYKQNSEEFVESDITRLELKSKNDNEERIIYMPLTTAQRIYGNNDFIDQINLTYNLDMGLDNAIALGTKLEKRIKKIFNIEPSDQGAVRLRNRATEANQINQFNNVLAILVLIIGIGTLIAGIVGISNIMIFIVKERTKEIGIRKALGARPSSIQAIILIESVLITAISGYVGLLLGIGILEAYGPSLDKYFITDPSVSTNLVAMATLALIISGFIAAYVPAKRASQIKPIIALRDE